jgi:CRISPR-associated endonuclease/helicase Cas3
VSAIIIRRNDDRLIHACARQASINGNSGDLRNWPWLNSTALAVSRGQCICWIRNTVHDAREAYRRLQASSWVAIERLSLFHSRFVLADRLAIEQWTLTFFGENAESEERHGRILIATQVVEQSLDLDFDQMVSDLAPIDLLIQRAGRLRRHVRFVSGERNRAAGANDERGTPILHVFSPIPEEKPAEEWFKVLFPKANYVYPHTGMLWLTARLLARHKGWTMPDDARKMIEGVYGDETEEVPHALQDASLDAWGEWAAQSGLADMNALDFTAGYCLDNAWDDEARIPTRLAEDSVTIFCALAQEENLVPLCINGPSPWDLSSIDTPSRRISGVPEKSAMRQVAETLKSEEKRFDETSVILPLTPLSDERWGGEAVDGEGRIVRILYDKEYGLLIGDETESLVGQLNGVTI